MQNHGKVNAFAISTDDVQLLRQTVIQESLHGANWARTVPLSLSMVCRWTVVEPTWIAAAIP